MASDVRVLGYPRALGVIEHGPGERIDPSAVYQTPSDIPLITVILCTRARRALLDRCLLSLSSLDDRNHEVLVVENAHVPMAAGVAGGQVRWVHEPRPGLAFARNTGIREALGQIVAFVDDDCEVSSNWLTELRRGFDDPAVSCVTGRVLPSDTDLPSQRWFERLASFDRGPQPEAFHHDANAPVMPNEAALLGTGCNMAYRREMFGRVGSFDVGLDTPNLIRGGGDLDMFARVLEGAERAVYVPTAIVRHHHRETLPSLARQLFGYGVGLGALSAKYLLDRRASLRTVVAFQRDVIAWMLRRRRGGSRLLGAVLIGLEVAGDLIGPVAYPIIRRRNRRRADP